jgi:endogenous inhibitor of DNA gyrase (YacG/DUF329 family)
MEPIKEVPVAFVRRYKLVAKQCPVCGSEFEGSPLRVYCTTRCAKIANWRRHNAEYNANRAQRRREHGQ